MQQLSSRSAVKRISFLCLIILSIFIWLAGSTTPITAQTTPDSIDINYTQLAESPDQEGVQLQLYFTPYVNGRPISATSWLSGEVILEPEDGGTLTAQIVPVQGPFTLVLVLDASGSMIGKLNELKDAAKQLVDGLPEGASVAIISFNRNATLLVNYSQDKETLKKAIDQVKSFNRAPTCLFDAALQGVKQVQQTGVKGRRALVVFTDGKDDDGNGSKCSIATVDDVITQANVRDSRVPIYAVGWQDPTGQQIAIDDLRKMATETSGSFAVNQTVTAVFADLQAALSAQRVAVAQIYPRAGEHTVTLKATTSMGTILNDTITFFSPRDYLRKPTPVVAAISIDSVRFDNTTSQIIVDPLISDETGIKDYEFRVTHESGELLARYTIPKPLPRPLVYEMKNLRSGKLVIELRANTMDNQVITASKEVTYTAPTPIPVAAVLSAIAYDAKTDQISLMLLYSNRERIKILRFNIFDNATNNLVQALTFDRVEDRVTLNGINLGLKKDQKYKVELIPQDTEGRFLSASAQEFTYTPPDQGGQIPVAVKLDSAVQFDEAAQTVNINVQITNESEVSRYELSLINPETNEKLADFTYQPPLPNPLRLPLTRLKDGKVRLTIRAIRKSGDEVTESTEFGYRSVTPTAAVISVFLKSIQYDPGADVVTLDLVFEGKELIQLLSVSLKDSQTGQLINSFEIPPAEKLPFSVKQYNLESAHTYRVEIIPRTNDRILTENLQMSEFVYTPMVAAAPALKFERIEPSKTDTLFVYLQIDNGGAIPKLRFEFINTKSGLLIQPFVFDQKPAGEPYELDVSQLPADEYMLKAIGLDATEKPLIDTSAFYTRVSEAPTLARESLDVSAERALTLKLQVTKQDQITAYRATLRDASSISVQTTNLRTPPYDQISFNIAENVNGGVYTLVIEALDANNQVLSKLEDRVSVPAPPNIIERIVIAIKNNLLPFAILLAAVVIGVVFWLVQQRPDPSNPFDSRRKARAIAARDDINSALLEKTMPIAVSAPASTPAKLTEGPYFEVSENNDKVRLPIDGSIFTIGRSRADYLIPHNTVSRIHLHVQLRDAHMIAINQSEQGTYWKMPNSPDSEVKLEKSQEVVLKNGMLVRIGIITLTFHWPGHQADSSDMDATLPSALDDPDRTAAGNSA